MFVKQAYRMERFLVRDLFYTLALGLAYVLKAFSKKLKNLLFSPPKKQICFAFIKEAA